MSVYTVHLRLRIEHTEGPGPEPDWDTVARLAAAAIAGESLYTTQGDALIVDAAEIDTAPDPD